ncbi:MAG: helix-turn-helix transcriptional regulator [Actinomycetota bacterium]|nr:helix-turn-helix transcriptional regulator [Actinomycetota bacterium]
MTRLSELHGMPFEDYLSRLYLAMIRLGVPTAEALAQEGFHPEDLPRATAALEARELIDRSGPDSWEVRPPELALPRFAAALEARAQFSRAASAELGVLWRQARKAHGATGVRGVEGLLGVPDIVQAVRSLQGLAESHLRLLLDDSPASQLWLRPPSERPAPRPEMPTVTVSCVVDMELLNRPEVLGELERRSNAGERIRVARNVPFSCVVADQSAAMVDLSRHHPQGDGSFVVRRRPAIAALTQMIEVAFAFSTPLLPTVAARERPADKVPLGERDRRILGLLATGASDQLIARHTGVSTRTVERRVRYLMDHLGASTRFQAGVAAARRGWI